MHEKILVGLARWIEKSWYAWQDTWKSLVRLVRRMVSLAMILHDHGSLGKILARSCQDLGKHTHASWQACQDSCHWENNTHKTIEKQIEHLLPSIHFPPTKFAILNP